MNILFATSEVFPLIKTGGLADVSAGLPAALQNMQHDVRIVLPGYPGAMKQGGRLTCVAEFTQDFPGKLMLGRLPKSKVPVLFVDIAEYFQRAGNPYSATDGHDWSDNARRFTAFSKVVQRIANDEFDLNWQPQVVHCNDWQTGLIPALLAQQETRPATIFTIHNIAYQGLFPASQFAQLDLPETLWNMDALEFHGQLSFMKGGLAFADIINTVSPSYAEEITTATFGYGLEGLLQHRQNDLYGILNGIDYKEWNPARDSHLASGYSRSSLVKKNINKTALQAAFGLPQRTDVPLIGMVGRMVEQKGYDLVADALPDLLQQDLQVVILGSGDKALETRLLGISSLYDDKLGVKIGYDESLAHLLEGGSDIFLMPSRFEPCGLNQMYSQRYGTLPVVHYVGGLIDSVTHIMEETINDCSASGFQFYPANPEAMTQTLNRALDIYRNQPELWRELVRNAMDKNFSWDHSAEEYLQLYQKAAKSQ